MTNLILATDSYKQSHFLQYPPEARVISAYAEARTNPFSDEVVFLGLQPFLMDYLSKPVTKADVEEAEAICSAHGVPFNRAGWDIIVEEFDGFLPIEIKALPEGQVVPSSVPLVQVQNTDVSAGQLGGLPAINNQQINATIQAQSRLQTEKDFENIVLRVNTDGSQVRVRDVARVELGAQSYDVIVRYDRRPASGMAISLSSGANALETIKDVKARVEELRANLPDSVKVVYPVDSSPFIELSTIITPLYFMYFLFFIPFFSNLEKELIKYYNK